MKVAISLLTYKRPKLLRQALNSLCRLQFRKAHAPELTLVVVDNDPEKSAKSVVDSCTTQFPGRVIYAVETCRGVACVRNRAVGIAIGFADFVAFMDDDEIADPFWLDELLAVQKRYSLPIVTGPIVPRYTTRTPEWVKPGEFFGPYHLNTGDEPAFVGGANVLADAALFRSVAALYDERLALRGGEDTHFYLRLKRAGVKAVWADSAMMYEWVSPSRATAHWLLQRAYGEGNNFTFLMRYLNPSKRTSLIRLVKGLGMMAAGAGQVVTAFSRPRLVRGLQRIFRGMGTLTALFGVVYHTGSLDSQVSIQGADNIDSQVSSQRA
jgi:GT2 family glycosyltransferase